MQLMNIDWSKWGAPAVVLAVTVFVVTWSRPAFIALLHYMLRYDEAKSRETLMIVLKSDDGKLKIKAYIADIFSDKWERDMKTHETALANRDSLAQVVESQKLQGHALQEIRLSLEQVPALTKALEGIGESVEEFARQMQNVSIFIARADEREKLRAEYAQGLREERRRRQSDEHPNHRIGDRNQT
jgi:hypothetical protein